MGVSNSEERMLYEIESARHSWNLRTLRRRRLYFEELKKAGLPYLKFIAYYHPIKRAYLLILKNNSNTVISACDGNIKFCF